MLSAGIGLCALQSLTSAAALERIQTEETRLASYRDIVSSETVNAAARQVYRLLIEVEGTVKVGTGFLVSGKRIIATNYHVIDKGVAISVGFLDDRGMVRRVGMRILAVYPQKDLALLEALDDLPGEALPLASGYPKLAADLVAIGFPAAADPQDIPERAQDDSSIFFMPSVLKGYVSRILPNPWFSSQLQHQTPIIPGYSGGPLIGADGSVFAISSSTHKEANGISYGVLAADLVSLLAACSLPAVIVGSDDDPRSRRVSSLAPRQAAAAEKPAPVKSVVVHNAADETMLRRGYEYLERGDIISARLLFGYLVENRDVSDAYAGLARAYDPLFLNRKNVIGVSGDASKARDLYAKAERLGASAPGGRDPLRMAINATGCNKSLCMLMNGTTGPVVECER